jgi:hypothetical protein
VISVCDYYVIKLYSYTEVHFVGLFKNVIHLIKEQHIEHTKQTKFFVEHLADHWKSLLNNVDNILGRSASTLHCHSLLVAVVCRGVFPWHTNIISVERLLGHSVLLQSSTSSNVAVQDHFKFQSLTSKCQPQVF